MAKKTVPDRGRREFLSVAVPGVLASLTPAGRGVKRPALLRPSVSQSDDSLFADVRRQFLIPEDIAYCNTGTLGASPREVVDTLVTGTLQLERDLANWPYEVPDGEPLTGYQELRSHRAVVGRFLNAPVDEIAFTQNATMGMGFLAQGLDVTAGDEVVSTNHEHRGSISPWLLLAKRRGIVVKQIPLEPAFDRGPEAVVRLFEEAFTPRTRAIVFSHVTSALGIRLPARELCALARGRNVLSIVNGAQATGQIVVDVKALGCDAYIASPHKWMMAPKGTGVLYIRQEVQDRFWTTLASTAWDDGGRGAFRFMQYGTGSVPVADALVASVRFIERVGMPRIERWDAMLTARLRAGLARVPGARLSSPQDPRLASAITTFRVEGMKARALQDALWARKVRVRAQNDARGVRLSAHLYVSPAQIDTVLEVVQAAARGKSAPG